MPIIERLLANAKRIYADFEPSDLETDIQFVNKLLNDPPKKILLPSTDIVVNRDKYRTQQDEADEDEAAKNLAPDRRVPYAPELSEIVKLSIALQNLRVMGQVLRNFPGVLTADPKYRLAEASYLLGLRTLRRVLRLAEQNTTRNSVYPSHRYLRKRIRWQRNRKWRGPPTSD